MVDGSDPSFGGRDLIDLGAMLVGAIVGWTVVGLLVDHWLNSGPAGVLTGVGLGIVSAAAGFVVRMRRALGSGRVSNDGD